MRPDTFIPAIIAMLGLAACAAPRSPLPATDLVIAELEPAFSGTAVLACLQTPLAAQRGCRDTIVQAMLVAIDLRYAEFEIGFFDVNRGVNFGASAAVIGLGAAGSLAATGTAQVLSALAGAVTGTREAFGRDLLVEQTAPALLTTMRAQRNTVGLRLREGLRVPAEQYPLGVALSDLYAYYRAGTVPGALSGLTQLAGVEAQAAQDDLRLAIPVAQVESARCLQRMLGDETLTPAARAENRRLIRLEMDRLGIPASVRPDSFAFDPAAAPQQRSVAQRLACPS